MKIYDKIVKKHYCLILAVVLFVSCQTNAPAPNPVKIYSFPEETNGVEIGVSAAYAGVVENNIVFMGGCNFPNVPASEGGKKEFYKSIYLAPIPSERDSTLSWQKIGEIELPSAYGFSTSMLGGVVCVGGTTSNRSLSSANFITVDTDSMEVTINPLPDLPVKLDNMGGAASDTMIYIVGGNADGIPSNRVFLLDFTNLQQEWVELPPFPGSPRVQPVCAVMTNPYGERALYVWGGFAASQNGEEPTLSPNGYTYSFRRGEWQEISAPKVGDAEIFLGGGASASIDDTLALFAGGVNRDIFLEALQREAKMKVAEAQNDAATAKELKKRAKEYMLQSPEWYKFNNRVLIYNSLRNNWEEIVVTSATARAGAVIMHKEGVLYSIGGELKPGVRVPQVVSIVLE